MGSSLWTDVSPVVVLLPVALLIAVRARRRFGTLARVAVSLAFGLWTIVAGAAVFAAGHAVAAALPDSTEAAGDTCLPGQTPRQFSVSLINLPLFLNRFGDVVSAGRMYVLDENIATVRETFTQAANPALAGETDLVEPLTLRVNRGDCVVVSFTNRLNEPAPSFNRDDSIFTLPGETLAAPGTVTPEPRQYAPSLTLPLNEFDSATAPRASMHVEGLDYDVTGSDGTAVGNNPDSTAAPGQTVTYRYYAGVEGEFQFKDGADFTSGQTRPNASIIGSQTFGAFGAFVVEAPGATWVDARTGGALKSGTRAVIKHPKAPDFREHVLYMHDEVGAEPGILTRLCRAGGAGGGGGAGEPEHPGEPEEPEEPEHPEGPEDPDALNCVAPTAEQLAKLTAGTLPGLSGGDANALINGEVPIKLEWFAFNYRAEPAFNREEVGCAAATRAGQGYDAAACVGEETSLSSWAYGDPGGGDLVFANYRGEPTQVRLLHAAELETHTFHWHVNRWPLDPADEGGIGPISNPNNSTSVTNVLDVQAVSPGSSYGLTVEGGAGSAFMSKPATFGDIIFHCHLYPHFTDGMWGLNRTLDKLASGDRRNPDGTPIPALVPLEDFDYQPTVSGVNPPPLPATVKPGYPFFIPGKFGFKAPKSPLGVPERQATGVFPPTPLERLAADPGAQVPGGFFQNPCPAGRPTKTFNVAAIQISQIYNDDLNWRNPQSRVYVLQEDKAAVLAGKKPEPFSPLLNVGDCVVYNLTNELPVNFGGNVFDRAQTTNEVGIHQHMVLFDVLSSDGAANGWNYDQGADPNQTFTYRDFVHTNTVTNSFHDHFFPNIHQDNGLFGGSTIHDAGCSFFDPTTGQPVRVGTIVDIRCTTTTDYRGNTTSGTDYRNVSLFVEDRVPMFQPDNPATTSDDQFVTPEGVPIHPATFPSGPEDQGVMGVNYRLEPFEARRNADPSKLFDSRTNGKPFTPYPMAFEGDQVRFRLFQLSQEESHGFNLDGFSWKSEPRDPDSNIVQAQHIGMLEYFDVQAEIEREGGDRYGGVSRYYQYNYGAADDWFLGAWGILEVKSCDDGNLVRLPDNGSVGGCEPPDLVPQSVPCPIGSPLKTFDVAAINKDITYNQAGDHDPNGLMYALEADVPALQAGTKQAEPLVLRVNAGDCIRVTLTNRLDPTKMKPQCFESTAPGQLGYVQGTLTYPECVDQQPRSEVNVPGFQPFPVSSRVSMRPQLVKYYAASSGTNVWGPVGPFGSTMRDGTVGPGESTTYLWYARPGVTGMGILEDRADVQNHLHHGLYGALVIEPQGSAYLDPKTGAPLASGTQAVIVNPNQSDFRENIVLLNSNLALFRKDTNDNPADDLPVPSNLDLSVALGRQADDTEDRGEFSVNYGNEPWSHRYANDQDIANIFSSVVHGDPSTPLFRAYGGDDTWFRVGQAVGDARSTSFALHDHVWRRSPNDPQSTMSSSQGQFNPGVVYNVHLDPNVAGGAGGLGGRPGDYLYRSGTLMRHLIGGQWGIFRVHAAAQPDLIALPDHPVQGAPTANLDSLPPADAALPTPQGRAV